MIKRHRNEKLIRAAGMRLRELQEARGLSQEKVLFETNIHLSNIENGRQDITIATLVELCSTYDTSLEDFFKGMKYARSGTK
ncbi:MAG: helix-turn-helix domain-containing protein [Alistipes putredinis]|uniref:helix-turn-helix domain-containing protein n=1 Tax=Alistipes putredinis TaxID=28117 RepID=UPI0039911DFC